MLSKLVRGLDVNILLAAFVIHTITSMFSVRNTLRVNNCFNEVNIPIVVYFYVMFDDFNKFHLQVDMQLNLLNPNNELHSIKARRRITILLYLALFSIILMLSMLKMR